MKRRAIVLLTGVLLCLAAGGAQAQSPQSGPAAWQELLDRAETLADRLDHDSAAVLTSLVLGQVQAARGVDDTATARVLDRLGVYQHLDMVFDEAESLLTRALAIRESILGPNHPDIAVSLGHLADLYMDLTRYAEAEPLYERAIAITREHVGEKHPDYAARLNDLGRIRYLRGNYVDAERMHREALAIREKTLGADHPDAAQSLTHLAEVVWKQRRFVQAEDLCRSALTIRENDRRTSLIDLAGTLTMLATAVRGYGAYDSAEVMYQRALGIVEVAYGPDHLHTIRLLNRLAALYVNIRRWEDAESYAQRALAAADRILPADHFEISCSVLYLGAVRMSTERYGEAMPLFERALAVRRKVLGSEHHDVASVLGFMSGSDYLRGDYESAMAHDWEAIGIRLTNYIKNSAHLTEYDAIIFNYTIYYTVSSLLTSFVHSARDNAMWERRVADIVLTAKGIVTDGMLSRQEFRSTSGDPAVSSLRERLRQIHATRSRWYFRDPRMAAPGSRRLMDSLWALARELESELSQHGDDLQRSQPLRAVSSEHIADALPPGAILVEYYQFTHFDQTPEAQESAWLVAVVVDGSGIRTVRNLGPKAAVEPLIEEYQRHVRVRARGDPATIAGASEIPDDILSGLYQQLWKPIEDAIEDDALVFIAPDAALNLVAFAGLKDESGHFLIERHPLHYLGAGRDLLRIEDSPVGGHGLFALGDPDFDAPPGTRLAAFLADSVPTLTVGGDVYAVRNIRSECEDLRTLAVEDLPGTRREIAGISGGWRQMQDSRVRAFVGAAASEETVKRVAPGHRVIHIATHGFYLDPSCQEPARRDESGEKNALLHCGLLLAGANLHGEGADEAGVEDGILSAAEVGALDLSNTQLVVLSACESGLGDIAIGQAVFGLQRAFRMAGARTVICALWPVSDQVTVDIMDHLYRSTNPNLAETLRSYAVTHIETARRLNRYPDPYYWAPFIAIGDWKLR